MPSNVLSIMARARGNSYLARAIGEITDYVQAVALREKALKRQQALPAVQWPSQPVSVEDDVDMFLSGVAAAVADERTREAQALALANVVRSCNSVIEQTLTVHADRILKSLHTDMRQLFTDVDEVVGLLRGARNAEQAITAGTADAWAQLPPLRKSYDEIRQAQAVVMAETDYPALSRTHYCDEPLASDLMLRNLDTIWPDWRQPPPSLIMLSGSPPDRWPWPNQPIPQLIWLSVSDAEPWVPTQRKLDSLFAERQARLNPPPKKTPTGPVPRQTSGPDAHHRVIKRVTAI
ncbi:MAG: Uncharacterized protein JWR32_3656 [Mycobacterium sp.]|nr:Uncharacterized protein [Mycobacterium sp.]